MGAGPALPRPSMSVPDSPFGFSRSAAPDWSMTLTWAQPEPARSRSTATPLTRRHRDRRGPWSPRSWSARMLTSPAYRTMRAALTAGCTAAPRPVDRPAGCRAAAPRRCGPGTCGPPPPSLAAPRAGGSGEIEEEVAALPCGHASRRGGRSRRETMSSGGGRSWREEQLSPFSIGLRALGASYQAHTGLGAPERVGA